MVPSSPYQNAVRNTAQLNTNNVVIASGSRRESENICLVFIKSSALMSMSLLLEVLYQVAM